LFPIPGDEKRGGVKEKKGKVYPKNHRKVWVLKPQGGLRETQKNATTTKGGRKGEAGAEAHHQFWQKE